jgi:hypothetical protein
VAGIKVVDSGNNLGQQRKDEKSCKCKCHKKTSDKETVYRQLNIQVMQTTIKNHGKLLVKVGSLSDVAKKLGSVGRQKIFFPNFFYSTDSGQNKHVHSLMHKTAVNQCNFF